MERYLGARENTDALTFKKAASHSRQNHATPLPLCTARNPWCLQPPSSPVNVQLQTNTQTHTKCTCVPHCHMWSFVYTIVLDTITRMCLSLSKISDPKCKPYDSATIKFQNTGLESPISTKLTNKSQYNTLENIYKYVIIVVDKGIKQAYIVNSDKMRKYENGVI